MACALALVPVLLIFAGAAPVRDKSVATAKPLKINMQNALSRAMRENATVLTARLNLELAEIAYRNAWDTMYLPRITLGTTMASSYTLGQIAGSTATNPNIYGPNGNGSRDFGALANQPLGSVALNIGEYRLYNFGRDKDTYEIARNLVDRARQMLVESVRAVRIDVLTKLFTLKSKQDLLDVSQRSVDQAQAIMSLIQSRQSIGKATAEDLSSAGVDLLNAKNSLLLAETDYKQATWALNLVLGDPVSQAYDVDVQFSYKPIAVPVEELLKLYRDVSPQVRNARLTLDQSQIALRLAEKNVLPLPTVTLSGLTIGETYNHNGPSQVRTTGANNSGNIDVGASLNFTIPLTGDGGLFGTRTIRQAEIAQETAEIGFWDALRQTDVQIRTQYAQILQLESQIKNNEKLLTESATVLEGAMKKFQHSTEINRLDLKNAIEQVRSAEQNFTGSIIQHISLKYSLAQLVGVDVLPGDHEEAQ